MLTRLLAFTLALLGLRVQLSAQANGPWTIVESGVARVSPIQVTRGTFVHLFSRENLDFLLTRESQITTMSAYRDGRFISSYCPVIECGMREETMHQVNEHVALYDIQRLTEIYVSILKAFHLPGFLSSGREEGKKKELL